MYARRSTAPWPWRRARSRLIPTGLYVAVPQGFEIQVRPRSGLALKHGLSIVNSPGTIDADYRGEVGIIVGNIGREPFTDHAGPAGSPNWWWRRWPGPRLKSSANFPRPAAAAGGFGHSGTH